MHTPWGKSDRAVTITPGLTWVSTPSHGGFMAKKDWASSHLTQEAIAEGESCGDYIAFEEDCACNVVIFEYPSPTYQALFCNTPLEQVYQDARRAIAFWLPIYALRRDLDCNRERAVMLSNDTWYTRRAELAELLALTA